MEPFVSKKALVMNELTLDAIGLFEQYGKKKIRKLNFPRQPKNGKNYNLDFRTFHLIPNCGSNSLKGCLFLAEAREIVALDCKPWELILLGRSLFTKI
jgi:hypothetical protein